ncbi:MAG: hypothetical protein HKN12_09780 [Gemmatimonadetes bacterium]|nr:hypothetical protein [Gemmatimonadota bacterium]
MRTLCHRTTALLIVLLFASGCGVLDNKYETAELSDALKGMVPSASDRYRIAAPAIPVMKKNIGIVRDEGLFLLIVGPDLKTVLNRYEGEELEYGVHLRRKPQAHLVLERVWAGGEPVATLETEKFRYRLPDFVNRQEVAVDQYQQDAKLCEVEPGADAKLASAVDHKIYASDFHVARYDVPELIKGTDLARNAGRSLDRPQYFITSAGSDYLVTSRDPMTFLALEFLLSEKREFRGGIVVQGLFDHDVRVATGVAGTAEVRWCALGGPLYFRGHGGV